MSSNHNVQASQNASDPYATESVDQPSVSPSPTRDTQSAGSAHKHGTGRDADVEKSGNISLKDVAAQETLAKEHDVFAVGEGEDAVNFKSLTW